MLSKNTIKHIQSLSIKKYRTQFLEFIAEGEKIIHELLLSDIHIKSIYATPQWLDKNKNELQKADEYRAVNEIELKKISNLSTPNEVLIVCKIPKNELNIDYLKNELSIVLDNVQDPGNFGTIIRLADWFGIKNIICSKESADCYNPKVIQATMGSITRVKIHYEDLVSLFEKLSIQTKLPVYGALLNGKNIYEQKLSSHGIIIMGNESNGISNEIRSFIKQPLFIPSFNSNKEIDSLNVAMATAIICSEFKRLNPINR